MSLPDRNQLAQQDFYHLLMPLELGPSPHSIAAHTRKMVQLLRDTQSPHPCGDAVDHLVRLYERSVPATPGIACKKGCGHCCSQPVLVTAPEAFHVAAQLHDRSGTRAAIEAAVEQIAALAPDRRWRDWPRCPMLSEENCSVYAARPLGCHAFVSMRLQSCLAAFVERGEPDIPMPQLHTDMLQACRMAFYAAIRLAGLHDRAYELNLAVHRILNMSDAEARWLKGEDVLAGLEDSTPIPPHVESQIAGLTAFISPTL